MTAYSCFKYHQNQGGNAKAAEYLALCTGYPKNVRVQLYKTDQKFNTQKDCHEITFTLLVRQPEKVDMDAPISESNPAWGLIQQVNHEAGLVENKQAIRFFQTDFNRFARILMKQLGYGRDYVVRIPSVSQSHDSKNWSVYTKPDTQIRLNYVN